MLEFPVSRASPNASPLTFVLVVQNDSFGTTGNGGVAEEIDAAAVPTYTARIAIQKEVRSCITAPSV